MLPTYAMACFLLPETLCQQINGCMPQFWWGRREEEHHINWLKMEKTCDEKRKGGLGFMDLSACNLALLSKLVAAGYPS